MNDHFLYSITDALPAAIYKIRIGGSPWRVFEFVSHGFEDLFEIPREIVLRDFDSFWAMVNAEDRMRIDESSKVSMQSRTRWSQDFRVLTQSNKSKWVRGTSFPEQPSEDGTIAWNGVFVDITEQKRAEMALRQSIERFQRVVDGAIDGLWDAVVEPGMPWQSPQTQIYYSPRLKALLGFQEHEFENNLGAWAHRLHPDDRARVMKALGDHIERRVPYGIEYRLLTKAGEYRWFQARGQAVWDQNGNVTRMAGSLNDIHRRKEAEEQLRQSQKLEAIGTLASGIAHEFDNLLAAISIHVNLAKTTLPASHPAVRSLERVEMTARHARGVTNGLLTFSHRASPQRSVIDLPRVIRTTLDMLGRILPPGIKIDAQLPGDRSIWVHASASLLEQICLNLAINAQDAMPAGGRIRVVVEAVPADGCDGAGDFAGKARVVFSDNGAGIPPGDLPRIFEPFFTTKARGKGTGLGLSIVMEIVRDLQG
ncbi:MAG TPA: PAS domain-containing protein, partial [Phycisphaerae bacterium]|nr:PAS domain-containing protein [Phycisphaerae bacterium]